MASKSIFFDLDGTLTDSGEGIINCVTLALNYFHLPVPSREALRVFVGPPLRDMFIQHGVPKDQADKAVEVFRSRYTTVGIYENFPYPGIPELLETLKRRGYRLFVATSKPEVLANRVLNRFQLKDYFEAVCGSTLDGSRESKADVITYLKNMVGDAENPVMVGDTAYDVIGAREHGIPTIGVSWGYGSAEEMRSAGAVGIANTPQELLSLLEK